MLTIMVFGELMQEPLEVKSDVTLDLTDAVTTDMVQNILEQAMQAVSVGRKVYANGKPVLYLVQAIDPNAYTDMVFENKN